MIPSTRSRHFQLQQNFFESYTMNLETLVWLLPLITRAVAGSGNGFRDAVHYLTRRGTTCVLSPATPLKIGFREFKIVAMQSALPRDAPCEGVGGLSKVKEVAAVPVALASSINDAIKNAAREVPAEVRRIPTAAVEAYKTKSKVATSLNKKGASKATGQQPGGITVGRRKDAPAYCRDKTWFAFSNEGGSAISRI